MMRYKFALICALFLFVTNVFAEELKLTEEEKTSIKKSDIENQFWFAGKHTLKVVQNRYFKKEGRLELNFLSAGYFLKNQYIDILSLGGGISYYFSELWGWQIINGRYMSTKLRGEVDTLREQFGVTAKIPEPKYFLTTNLLWIPMYGKFAVLESSFVYYDIYFLLGGGVVHNGNEVTPAANLGFGLKFFMAKNWVTSVDLRQYYYEETRKYSRLNYDYDSKKIRDKVVLTIGMSYVL